MSCFHSHSSLLCVLFFLSSYYTIRTSLLFHAHLSLVLSHLHGVLTCYSSQPTCRSSGLRSRSNSAYFVGHFVFQIQARTGQKASNAAKCAPTAAAESSEQSSIPEIVDNAQTAVSKLARMVSLSSMCVRAFVRASVRALPCTGITTGINNRVTGFTTTLAQSSSAVRELLICLLVRVQLSDAGVGGNMAKAMFSLFPALNKHGLSASPTYQLLTGNIVLLVSRSWFVFIL